MEQRVGSLIKSSDMCLDLGAMEDGLSSWFDLVRTCKKARPLPLSPERFNELMDEKAENGAPKIEFTVEDDRKLIKGLYETTFAGVVGNAKKIYWYGLGWDCELTELMPVLVAAAPTLEELNLENNGIRGSIPADIGKLTNLKELWLDYNKLEGSCALLSPPRGESRSLRVVLSFTRPLPLRRASPAGRVPSELKQLTRLERLYLGDNPALEKPPGCPLDEYGRMIYIRTPSNKEAVAAFLACLP